MTNRTLALSALTCLALAAVSLVVAREPVYDAWAWLTWGRELAALDLDTSSGPSWKPLPVVVTAVLSLAGDAAPALWLVLVRASWLISLVLAGRLAHALTAQLDRRLRLAAAGFAVGSLLLLADGFTMWTRQGAAGMSEPLLVALVLGAVAASLEGRTRVTFALAGLAALVRPEVWPLLAAYGLWRWRADTAPRPQIALVGIAVALLWLAPELIASGGASAGERALRGGGAPLHEGLEALDRAAAMPLVVAWPLMLLAVTQGLGRTRHHAWRFRPDPLIVLAAGALGWIATVAAMAVAGFPGLPRFMAPAVAVVGVLAGVGLARLLALACRDGARRLALAALIVALLVTAVQLPGRAAQLPEAIAVTERIARSHDRLRDLAGAVGRERLLRCGKLATSDVLVRTALAWELDVPLSEVVSFGVAPTRSGAFVVGLQASAPLRARIRSRGDLLGRRGEWSVYSIDCPPAAAATSAIKTGVSGARR